MIPGVGGRRPTNRDIVGLPIVPPPQLTTAVLAVRRWLGRAHRRMAPGQVRILEGLFGLFDNRVLGLLVELGIADLLDTPRPLDELAARGQVDRDALERVLRYAAGRGFVAVDRRGRYGANDVTRLLRRDHPNPWRGWVEFLGSDWHWDAWRHADDSLRRGTSGMEAATGVDFFEYVNRSEPAAGAAFNAAMAAGATMQALALSRALDWSDVTRVCDVGGGTGAALELLLGVHPQLEGVLFDLPEVVAQARPRLRDGDLAGRCQMVGGSFFDDVPAGCDRYLLLAVVHDWDDAAVVRLLGRVREASHTRSRVVVVENVLPARPDGDLADATHLLMRVLVSGRERTRVEYASLFARAGLVVDDERRLASGFTAFVLCEKLAQW